MWKIGKLLGALLQKHYSSTAVIYGIQDGPAAGQTVAHVHLHVIPRYTKIGEAKQIIDDESRKDRTKEDRATEAATYKKLLLTALNSTIQQ